MKQLLLFDVYSESLNKNNKIKRIMPIHYIYWNENYYCYTYEHQQSIRLFKNLNLLFRKQDKRKLITKNDPIFHIKKNLKNRFRNLVRSAIKSKNCRITTLEAIGCDSLELRKHIESKFITGMSWENYGKWQIDHIKPVALFDIDNPEHIKQMNHFSNLQPLWTIDNLKKGAKYESQST